MLASRFFDVFLFLQCLLQHYEVRWVNDVMMHCERIVVHLAHYAEVSLARCILRLSRFLMLYFNSLSEFSIAPKWCLLPYALSNLWLYADPLSRFRLGNMQIVQFLFSLLFLECLYNSFVSSLSLDVVLTEDVVLGGFQCIIRFPDRISLTLPDLSQFLFDVINLRVVVEHQFLDTAALDHHLAWKVDEWFCFCRVLGNVIPKFSVMFQKLARRASYLVVF